MKLAFGIIISLVLLSCNQSNNGTNSSPPASSEYEYWATVMFEDSSNPQLNSFSLKEKYKIIEFAYNKIGLKSKFSYEKLKILISNEDPWDYIFSQEMQINRIAYWVLGLWGSYIHTKENEVTNWEKISNQVWYYDGEQSEINYLRYVEYMHKMRDSRYRIVDKNELYEKESNSFNIEFKYNEKNINWKIANESPGWINGIIFKLYTDLCKEEYKETGNYFMVMEGQGGYLMYLSFEAEEYLRTLWNFPKLNKQGKMMTLNDYGKQYENK